MKKFLLILVLTKSCFLLLTRTCVAQTTPLSFKCLPTTDPDLNRPFAGMIDWHGWNQVNYPNATLKTPRLDNYWRFHTTDLSRYNDPRGVYYFDYFDKIINETIDKGQKFAFGVMNTCCGNGAGSVDGGILWYPLWVHQAMQSSPAKDILVKGSRGPYGKTGWVPNYDNPVWIAYRKAFHQALNDHILKSSYKGVAYKDIILYIDCLEYGDYGEWATLHGTNPKAASLDSLISGVLNSYSTFQVQGQAAMLDGGLCGFIPTPKEVGYYALRSRNLKGPIGFSDFCLGCLDWFRKKWLIDNPNVVNGYRFDTAVRNRFRYAPMTGEPPGFGPEGDANLDSLESRVRWGPIANFGNGNFSPLNARVQANARAAAKLAGYKLVMSEGKISESLSSGGPYQIEIHWKNTGITPTYEHWKIVFELVQGNAVRWTSSSAFDPYLFLPGREMVAIDKFNLTQIPSGPYYTLRVRVTDPKKYRSPMPLFIDIPQNADGSYDLKTNMTVGSGTTKAKKKTSARTASLR